MNRQPSERGGGGVPGARQTSGGGRKFPRGIFRRPTYAALVTGPLRRPGTPLDSLPSLPAEASQGAALKVLSDFEVSCEFCGFDYPEGLGRYGCPNCCGEGC